MLRVRACGVAYVRHILCGAMTRRAQLGIFEILYQFEQLLCVRGVGYYSCRHGKAGASGRERRVLQQSENAQVHDNGYDTRYFPCLFDTFGQTVHRRFLAQSRQHFLSRFRAPYVYCGLLFIRAKKDGFGFCAAVQSYNPARVRMLHVHTRRGDRRVRVSVFLFGRKRLGLRRSYGMGGHTRSRVHRARISALVV